MQFEANMPGDDEGPAKTSRHRPKSTLENELNQALERLDHQVRDTQDYLASLDNQQEPGSVRKRRKGDGKPNSSRER